MLGVRPTAQSFAVLIVCDFFQPSDDFAVKLLLYCDMSHRCCRGGPVPVLRSGWNPDHITLTNFLDRSSPFLNPACAIRHDQNLTERMRVPCTPRARLERDLPSASA